jgi:hypothetical protein
MHPIVCYCQGAQYKSTIFFYLLKFIMLTIKVNSELAILASERKTTFTFLCLARVLKNATLVAVRACIP